MALMVVLAIVGSLLPAGKTTLTNDGPLTKIAFFSVALNHASIFDGIRLAEGQKFVEICIYRHCNMTHLNALFTDNTVDIANRDNFDNISIIYMKIPQANRFLSSRQYGTEMMHMSSLEIKTEKSMLSPPIRNS